MEWRAHPTAKLPRMSVDPTTVVPSSGEEIAVHRPDLQFEMRLEIGAALLPPVNPNRILRKAVQLIHAYPVSGDHTGTTRKVLNALILHAQDVFSQLSETDKQAIKDVRGTPVFRIDTGRLMQMLGWKSNYNRIYEAVDSLWAWSMRWNIMSDANGAAVISETFESRIITSRSRGDGRLAYEFQHDVLLLVLEPRQYGALSLMVINDLGSTYAISLYENCARYVNTNNRVTAVMPVDEWIRIIAGVGKYVGAYKEFKRFAYLPAQEWLAKVDSCPFTVEIREIRGPRRKVTHLQFKMTMKVQASLDMQMPVTWSTQTIDVLKKVFGMQEKDISLLSKLSTEAEVQEALARYRAMAARKLAAGDPIMNRQKYLAGILRNVQFGRPKDAEPEPEDEEVQIKPVQDAIAEVGRLQGEFEAHRLQRLRESLADLPGDTMATLRAEFEEAKGAEKFVKPLLKKGWATPHPGLIPTFLKWVFAERAEMAARLLNRPEDRDFAVWMVMQKKAG